MKAKIITIGKKNIIAGMTWDILDSKLPERKAIRKFLKANPGVKYGVLVSSITHKSIGVLPAGVKKLNAPSGAALLALAHNEINARSSNQQSTTSMEENHWLVVEKLGDDEYWVVEIRDGVVIPESDMIGNLEDVRSQIEMAIEDNTSFRVYTKDEDVKFQLPTGISIQNMGVEDLLGRIDKLSRGDLKTFSGVDPLIIGVVGGVFLVGFGYFAWSFYQDSVKKEQAALQASKRAKEQADKLRTEENNYNEMIKKSVLDSLDVAINTVTQALQTPAPKEVVQSWIKIIENVPFDHSGWTTTDISCSLETPQKPVCEVRLKRTDLGINRILLEDYPDVLIDGDSATYTIHGPDLLLRDAGWGGLDNSVAFSKGVLSDLQFFRHAQLSYTQGASKDIVQAIKIPEPPASLVQAARSAKKTIQGADKMKKPDPINTGVGKGDLGFSADELWRLEGIADAINLTSVQITNLDVKVSYNKISWNAKSSFFLRTKPAPIIPVIEGPSGPITIEMPDKYKELISSVPSTGGVAATSGLVIKETSSGIEPLQGEESGVPSAPTDPNAPPPVQGPISLGLPENN